MTDYILYTDRKENFSCDIALEGAKLNESFARIILETSDVNYVFNGTISDSDGPLPGASIVVQGSNVGVTSSCSLIHVL